MAAHTHTHRRLIVLVAASAAIALAALAADQPRAQASHPPSVGIEQHWDLLAETLDGAALATTIDIERGVLPGGTSVLDPAPSATFEVVGRHAGGGSNTTWTVDLKAGGSTLASVTFDETDSALVRKSVAFDWPATDLELDRIVATRGAGAGTFDLRRAYISLRQTGTPAATQARIPMAAKQLNPTNTTATIAAAPAFYRHVADDFDPAPTIRLRATGAATTGVQPHVRLATATGQAVSGSELEFTSNTITSKTTPALSLTDGTDYVVQVWIVELPSGRSAEANQAGLYNVDLIVEQSTTDAHGIGCTPGYYTGITALTELDQHGEPLGAFFGAPMISAPGTEAYWHYAAKRLTGAGAASVGVDLHDLDNQVTQAAVAIDGSAFTVKRNPLDKPPIADADLESVAQVNEGATGTASMSRLRVATCLHDLVGPAINDLSLSGSIFSPGTDGVKDTVSFSASITDDDDNPADDDATPWLGSYPIAYEFQVRDGATVLRTLDGTLSEAGSTGELIFDGTDDDGDPIADGTYDVVLTATDAAANLVTSAAQQLIIDTAVPGVANLGASPDAFSPDGDTSIDDTTIGASLTDDNGPFTWTLSIRDGAGGEVASFADAAPSQVSVLWDGSADAGGTVPDGTYDLVLGATDAAGNTATEAVGGLLVDTQDPVISGFVVADGAISPNGDAHRDATGIGASVSDDDALAADPVLAIVQGASTVRTFATAGATLDEVWDGTDDAAQVVAEGSYAARVSAADVAGNAVSASLPVIVDLSGPEIEALQASLAAFSPNGDGTADLTQIDGWLSDDSPPIQWTLTIRDQTQAIVRTEEGTGDIDLAWDGTDDLGQPLADGTYQVQASATDAQLLTTLTGIIEIVIDTTGPVMEGLGADNPAFSPDGDLVKDVTTITTTLSDPAGIDVWYLDITDSQGSWIAGHADSNPSVTKVWDGKTNQGQVVADGDYTATLSATDRLGNTATGIVNLVVDTLDPQIDSLDATPEVFAPGGSPAEATIDAQITEHGPFDDWLIEVVDGAEVLRSFSGTDPDAIGASWDGDDDAAQPVAEGTYDAVLTVTDAAGNTAADLVQVALDRSPPVVASIDATNPYFSPATTSPKADTTIDAVIDEAFEGTSWSLTITDGGGQAMHTATGQGLAPQVVWDGTEADGITIAPDGDYTATLSVVDGQGLTGGATTTVTIDRAAPAIGGLAASASVFSPGADGIADEVTISAEATDEHAGLTHQVVFTDAAETAVRTIGGTGGSVVIDWDGRADRDRCGRQRGDRPGRWVGRGHHRAHDRGPGRERGGVQPRRQRHQGRHHGVGELE